MPRIVWLGLTWLFVAFGVIGAVLPLIPTTPFLLVAAWAAPKASPELGRRLEEHRLVGPLLTSWRERRGLSRRTKALALCMLAIAWAMLLWRGFDVVVLVAAGALFLGIGGWLATRPASEENHGTKARVRKESSRGAQA